MNIEFNFPNGRHSWKVIRKDFRNVLHYLDQLNRRNIYFKIFDSYDMVRTPFRDHFTLLYRRSDTTSRNWIIPLPLLDGFIRKIELNQSCSTIYGSKTSMQPMHSKNNIKINHIDIFQIHLCNSIGQRYRKTHKDSYSHHGFTYRGVNRKWFNKKIG